MAEQAESDLPVINAFWAVVFTGIALIWPIALLGSMFLFAMHQARAVPQMFLFLATVAYGPVYLVSLIRARRYKREGNHQACFRTWMIFCGVNVVIWIVAFFWFFL